MTAGNLVEDSRHPQRHRGQSVKGGGGHNKSFQKWPKKFVTPFLQPADWLSLGLRGWTVDYTLLNWKQKSRFIELLIHCQQDMQWLLQVKATACGKKLKINSCSKFITAVSSRQRRPCPEIQTLTLHIPMCKKETLQWMISHQNIKHYQKRY